MELTNLNIIKSLLNKFGLYAKKSFGQNFLLNGQILTIMTDIAEISKDDHVIEIGPGLGTLTQELAKKAGKVTSIELDRNLIPILKETLKDFSNVEIINSDALLFEPSENTYKVVANIPYNITSHLISHFLQNKNPPESLTLLIQYEVAKKLCTLNPDMSVLSLGTALFGKAKFIKKVKKGSFFPVPKVDSAIIHISLYEPSEKEFIGRENAIKILNLAKKAFSQKRKKIKNPLPELKEKLTALNLAEKRPQELSIDDWENLMIPELLKIEAMQGDKPFTT
ncbi:ribosomal RNA small subunit methyltransferase A [Candidatus Peregrinibacteria bacterium RIFCSPLOWO2_02_FULL_39_10]|nr:MAG: ribosomal RNA small subunit methyltransferase A [Candidatus Peregrinibacteria bacterium RIFCSPLOWO2_02_FULL_39_10]